MQQDRLTFIHLKEEYVICICEGAAEQAIIELLLDHNSLVFAHDNLVGREVTRKRKASEIQSSFLNRAYQRRVNILRILDSKKDSFKLPPLYAERFPVHNIYTRPEIEMLLIIAAGQSEKYLQKEKSRYKPSSYCAEILFPGEHIKSRRFIQNYFADINKLHRAIRLYHEQAGKRGDAHLFHLLSKSLIWTL